ncbi:MAG: hypothetical protein U0840_09385 [Gemmataceae bacterium]
MTAMILSPTTPLQHAFLVILPTIEQHARARFRHVRCPHRREDCEAEAVALAWKWCVCLAQRGKDATAFPSTLAVLAARAVSSGRRVCGQESDHDRIDQLKLGERRKYVTDLLSSSRSCVSQERGEVRSNWEHFCDE